MRLLSRTLPLALLPALVLAAAGCSSRTEPGPAQPKVAAPVKKTTPADSLSPYLVGAVTTVKGGASMLQVKFELGTRPNVGDPVDVDLVIIPAADNIELISGTVQGDDGLEVVSGGTIPPTEKPTYGTPIHQSLKVRAKRDGIFNLSAALTVETGGQTLGPVYSMPLIAGNGLVDAAAAAAPGQKAARPAATASAK